MLEILIGGVLAAVGFVCGWLLARRGDAKHAAELERAQHGLTPVIPKSYGDGKPEVSK